MRAVFIFTVLALCIFFLNPSALAQGESGSTIINVTIPGFLGLNLTYPEIVISENYYFYENLTVSQSNAQGIYIYLNKSDSNNFVKFVNKTGGGTYYQDDYAIYVPSDSQQNVTLRAFVPSGQGFDGGTYDIPLYARSLSDYRTNATTLKIHVNSTNPIDDIEITSMYPSSLYPGESLRANVSIHKILPSGMADIQICYCINSNPGYMCGPSYNNYGCEWKAITEWLNYTKTVTVNENAGSYYLIVAVKYTGDENIKRANSPQFYVQTVPSGVPAGAPGGAMTLPPSQPILSILAPNYLEAAPGDRMDFTAVVRNTGNVIAPNTTLNIYGLPENWVSVSPSVQNIEASGSRNYTVSISLPGTAFQQVYSLSLVAKSGSVETAKIITLTVASTLEKRARFLLDEAASRKGETEKLLERIKNFGLDVTFPEKNMTHANALLEAAKTLFEARDFNGTLEKSKQAIDGYAYVATLAKRLVEIEYLTLLQNINSELGRAERLSKDADVIKSIKDKMSESIILQKEERIADAYDTLLDAKRLLKQLLEKIRMGETTNLILMMAAIIVTAFFILAFVLYKKKVSGFVRTAGVEEQKKRLRHMFRKEVGPSVAYRLPPKEPAKKAPAWLPAKPPEKPEKEAKGKEKLTNVMSWISLLAIVLLGLLVALVFIFFVL